MSATLETSTDGALAPLERLERLCDPGSLRPFRSEVASRAERTNVPGDGVVTAAGTLGGRPVFCYSQDRSVLGGSLGESQAESIVRLLRMAGDAGAPVVGFVESAGARVDEGTAGLGGYGRIFSEHVKLAGRVPQVTVITGTSAGGGSYSPALTDFVVMTEGSSMFLTGPGVVQEVTGEDVSKDELGGPRVHSRNGVCHLTAADDEEAVEVVRDLLAHLPPSGGRRPVREPAAAPESGDPSESVPQEARKVYDVRDVARRLADGGRLLEVSPRWARNMVTAFVRIDGRAVGLIANQPRYLGGVIDAAAAEKASGFVNRCSSFGLPLVVLVDTPGFLPGTRQERAGVIRHGAGLLRAFAGAEVPRVTVVLRKAYGGGFITMNAKDLGADLVLAWPGAEIGVVGPRQAVGLVHRGAIRDAEDPEHERDRLADLYAREHTTAAVAAQGGDVDEIVPPAETRERLAWALTVLGERP